MNGRPYWSGQLKISLVSFGIQLYPASKPQAGIAFHQVDRASGQRVRHLNVVGEHHPVDNSEIVKGYEYSKGKYLIVEPGEIARLRIATKSTIEISQFVDLAEVSPSLFEKPYFAVPQPKEPPNAFAVVRKALEQTNKAAIGEIAFAGREHLVVIAAPQDKTAPGLMAYMLRYGEELRDSKEYFDEIPIFDHLKSDKKQLSMAVDLIRAYSAPFDLAAFKDDYEAALRELIEAKQKDMPLPIEEEKPRRHKAIDLMDALRQSVNQAKRPEPKRSRAEQPPKKGPVLVIPNKRKRRAA